MEVNYSLIRRNISRFIKKVFPKIARSFNEFIEMLKGIKIDFVMVKPQSSVSDFPSSVMGANVHLGHGLKYVATALDGTKIIYYERISNQLKNAFTPADPNEEKKTTTKLLLVGEERKKILQAEFPDPLICLAGPNYEYMDDALLNKLHEEALVLGIPI